MIKLIVSDIDGTLVPEGCSDLNPELLEVILKLREKGIQFAAASGRPWPSVEKAFYPIRKKVFYIADNGGYLGCHGRMLDSRTMDMEITKELVQAAHAHPEVQITYGGANEDYIETGNDNLLKLLTEGYGLPVQQVEDMMEVDTPCIKFSFYKPGGIEEATADIYRDFKDRLKVTIAGSDWLDCMALGVNKGQAVKQLQDSLGISPRETMVFGDQLNDIEMLQQGYYSFAVANGRPEVRRAARFQADSNENNGVLKVLKQLL